MQETGHTKTVYMTIGFTGSGKSTWARQFAAQHPNTKIVSPDGFRTMFNGTYKYLPEMDDVINQSTFDAANHLLDAGYDVIIDCGNLRPAPDRRGLWKLLPTDRFVAILMPMNKSVRWYVERRQRNAHWPVNVWDIVKNEMKTYVPPSADEFDEIIQQGE